VVQEPGSTKDPLEKMGVAPDPEASMISVKDIIDGFTLLQNARNQIFERESVQNTKNDIDLEQKMVQFLYENPGRSYSAIFKRFKKEGFTHGSILETYNVLLYDKKILRRLNVGTAASPRYAHFVTEPPVYEHEKDVLYEILGPI